MEETSKKSFRNVARRYGATLENINAVRTASKKKSSRKSNKKHSKRKK